MSWSLNVHGKPEDIVTEINDQSTKLTGASKDEFDAVKDNLIGLVNANTGMLSLNANGHAYTTGTPPVKISNTNVELKAFSGRLVGKH